MGGLKRIEYFVSVAQNHSFTKAAKECYVAQTAISQQIQRFEKELGFQLFNRDSSPVSLTPAGKYFYHQCVKFLAEYNSTVQRAVHIANQDEETLHIGFSYEYQQHVLVSYLRQFHHLYPDITIKLHRQDKRELFEMLYRGEADILSVLSFDIEFAGNLEILSIGKDYSVFILGPDHPLAHHAFISPNELKNDPIILLMDNNLRSSEAKTKSYFEKIGLGENELITVDDYATQIMMVGAGLGVAIVPSQERLYLPSNLSVAQMEGCTGLIEHTLIRLQASENPAADKFYRMVREIQAQEGL